MKKQVFMIHGGDVFDTEEKYLEFIRTYEIKNLDYFFRKKWKNRLQSDLGDDYLVVQPSMPNKYKAQYIVWKMWFEKMIPFMEDGVILIGSSLGGIFLAKYLSEETLPVRVAKLFLIAAPFDLAMDGYDVGDFTSPSNGELLQSQCDQIYLYHSEDDPVVRFSELAKYREMLPHAIVRIFTQAGHFSVAELPEIVEDIKE